MAQTAGDRLVEKLLDWGVDTYFGIPGDGINGIIEALRTRKDRIKFVQVRHEEVAAFACVGYAKFSGKMAACIATSGPGGIHLLNGLYDAKTDGAPVIAITGDTYHDLIGTHYQQDVDLNVLFKPVCVYSERVMGPAHLESIADLACRLAITGRGVAHLNFPVDLQEQPMGEGDESKKNFPHHTSDVRAFGKGAPMDEDVARAAHVLNAGQKVVILAGAGALDAGAELEQVAEVLGAPIVKALLGKACVPDDSPYTTGGAGLLGTRPSEEALKDCDTLLLVGTSFPYTDHMPKPGEARAVQVDIDPGRIGLRYPVEVGLVGDSRVTLQRLLPRLRRQADRAFLEKAQNGMKEWWQLLEERAMRPGEGAPLKPQAIPHAISPLLADDAIVIADSGTNTAWAARHVKIRAGQQFSCSGTLATMACGLPYAIGAQVAFPDRQVVAFVGDGGFSMLMADFVTAVKYGLPIKVVIFKNNTLGQIKWEQMVFLGNPEYGVDLHPIDFVKFAEACGGTAFHLEQPGDLQGTVQRFLAAPGPALLEAVVDPFEPPTPPMIKPDQAVKMAKALARGEPNRERIALTLFRDQVDDFATDAPGPLEAIAEKVAGLVGAGSDSRDDRDSHAGDEAPARTVTSTGSHHR